MCDPELWRQTKLSIICLLVIGTILTASVLLTWLGHRNLQLTRAAAKRLAAVK